jgi:group I intron endonuclease
MEVNMDRHQLKLEYKNRPKNMGIYQIRNKVNGKIFVGSTLNLDGIVNRYEFAARFDWRWNGNSKLQKDMDEYGPDNFCIEILDHLTPNEDPLYNYSEDLKTLEELWLERLQPYEEHGYNKRPVRGKT